MGKPLMIQIDDDLKIENLKKRIGAKTKIEVVRTALEALETNVNKSERIKRWEKAAKIVGKSSLETLKAFNYPKRFEKLP